MSKKMAAAWAFAALLLAVSWVPALAQPAPPGVGPGGVTPVSIPSDTSIPLIIERIITWAFGLLILLAAVFIIWAAFLYLTSGGDEEKTATSKKYIWAAVVAIAIAALAQVVVAIVRGFLNV